MEQGQLTWLVNLRSGIGEVAALLREHPKVGREMARSEKGILRSIRLRRYPYVVWYFHGARGRIRDVWLVRLFGARQLRPRPDAASWRLP